MGLHVATAVASPPINSNTTFYISAPSGGDCALIGTWDSPSQTCTMGTDVIFAPGVSGVEIVSDGVTLDGNGHIINGYTSPGTTGVYLSGRTGVTIRDLKVLSFDFGFYLNSSSNNTLSGNTSGDPNAPLIYNTYGTNNTGYLLASSSGNTLSGNGGTDEYYGIQLQASSSNTFSGNFIWARQGTAIFLESGSNYNALSSNVTLSELTGIDIESSNGNSLWGNSVGSNNNTGIFLLSSDGNNISGGAVGGGNGIDLYSSSYNYISGITIYSSINGIWLEAGSGNNTISSNTASNSGTGIKLSASGNNTISSNTTSNDSIGIWLAASSNLNTLTGNTASSNSSYGIWLDSLSSYNSLSKNTTNSNSDTGIYLVSASSNTLSGNTVSSNSPYGIQLLSASNNTLTGNIASNNNMGIYINYYSNSNALTGNTASFNPNQGICLSSSSNNTLTGNVSSNNNYGISVYSSGGNTLTGNAVNSNGSYGIWLAAESGDTVSRNMVKSNSNIGIYVIGSDSNVIYGNGVILNGWKGIYLGYNNSNNNSVFINNFINNDVLQGMPVGSQAMVDGGIGNAFNAGAPIGGNYWSDWTTPDANNDGFIDSPYVFTGGQDNLPLKTAVGGGKPVLTLTGGAPFWASYADFTARKLSMNWTFTNTGANEAFSSRITGSTSNNGVTLFTSLPVSLGNGNIMPGAFVVLTLKYSIPPGVSSFNTATTGSAQNIAGATYTYP